MTRRVHMGPRSGMVQFGAIMFLVHHISSRKLSSGMWYITGGAHTIKSTDPRQLPSDTRAVCVWCTCKAAITISAAWNTEWAG